LINLARFTHLSWLFPVALTLAACGGGSSGSSGSSSGESSGSSDSFSIDGRVVNSPLAGSTVEVLSAAGDRLFETVTDADGNYSATLSVAGPYRIRTTGGTIDGEDYEGTLEAACEQDVGCNVTPYSTIIVRLVDEHNFNTDDAAGLIAATLGVNEDPFIATDSPDNVDMDVAREAIGRGDGLEEWVDNVARFATGSEEEGENPEPPPGLSVAAQAPETTIPGPTPDPDPVPDLPPIVEQTPPSQDDEEEGASEPGDSTAGPLPEIDQPSGSQNNMPQDNGESTHEPGDEDHGSLATFFVSSATLGFGGRIDPEERMVKTGESATFQIIVEDGYRIGGVSGCGGSLAGSTYTTGSITVNCVVTGLFQTLPSPENPQAKAEDAAVLISWDLVDGAESYNVYRSKVLGIHPSTAASYSGVDLGNV